MRRYTAIPAAIASATFCSLAGDLPDEAKARTRLDVSTVSVGSPPAAAAPGGNFSVKWRTARSGRSAALKKARLVFRLSADKKRNRGDIKLGRGASLSKLAKKSVLSGRTRLTVPAVTKTGSYHLIACVEGKALRDRLRANDCRASKRRMAIAPGPGGGGPPGGGGTPGGGPTGSQGPLNATPTLETGDSASSYITTAGGSLTAGDSTTGTIYTLTLPEDALVSPTQIRMTPVSSLAGVPGALVGAVKLEPEGLVLNKPATLEIQPGGDPPAADRQVAFTSEGDGKDFHLLPDPDGGLTVELLHFSIPGVGDMSSSDSAAVAARQPARSQAQYEQAIADAVKRGDTQAQITLSKGYYQDVVKPKLQAALTSDDAMDAAFAAALSWQRMASLLGIDDDVAAEYDEATGLLRQILENAANRAYARCVDDHDLTAVRRMVQVERIAELLGFSGEAGYADTVAKVNSCLTFELDFDSDMTTHVDDGGYTYHLQAQDVLFGPGVADPGALSWVEFTGGQAGSGVCGSSHETYNYTWDAEGHADSTIKPELLADINPRLPGAASADPLAGAMVAVFTDAPKERYRYTADGCSVTDDLVENEIWEAIFSLSDPDVSKIGGSDVGVGALTLYRNPEHGTPGSALLLVAQSTSDSPELQEDTSLQVWHRPQPLP